MIFLTLGQESVTGLFENDYFTTCKFHLTNKIRIR